MKTHVHLLLVLGSGFAALLLGAGLAPAFAVAVVAGVAGMAFNDYPGYCMKAVLRHGGAVGSV
ncbi:MAG: hypothetical protein H3C27_06145, partial [Opitutaceae bacterium]|nr:hypothetical protein [Opitutaceae bacterium]